MVQFAQRLGVALAPDQAVDRFLQLFVGFRLSRCFHIAILHPNLARVNRILGRRDSAAVL